MSWSSAGAVAVRARVLAAPGSGAEGWPTMAEKWLRELLRAHFTGFASACSAGAANGAAAIHEELAGGLP